MYETKPIVSTREEAELVLRKMGEVIEKHSFVSRGDLFTLLGQAKISYIDDKYGWTDLSNVEIRKIEDGYLINLPAPVEIQKSAYSIETINPNVAYLVTLDDKPFCAPDGQDLIFHRRRDAERFMKEQQTNKDD